jgi:hypothetical protein
MMMMILSCWPRLLTTRHLEHQGTLCALWLLQLYTQHTEHQDFTQNKRLRNDDDDDGCDEFGIYLFILFVHNK